MFEAEIILHCWNIKRGDTSIIVSKAQNTEVHAISAQLAIK